MASERIQRRIERLLDQAEEAADRREWELVRQRAEDILTFDPDNPDASGFLVAAQRALGTTVSSPVADSTPSAPPHPTSFANGRYTVRRFLGEGGKKKVYLAHDTRLDRDIAFALIKTEGLDEAARARISREAQAMGRLGDHPHIVTIFDIGQEEGQPYLVLPLMPGGDVGDLIEKAEKHQLPLDTAIRITDQLCQALEHAHTKGIIHRDIKPGNVWLTQDGTAKLGDFGLAVAIDRSRLTQAGMMVGTVSYMPPEQAMGGTVEARSDLYSVGCMLYEMVTGRPPFVGDDNIAIIGQHLNTPPVSPSWHHPDLPKGLETLILRLLEKDPNRRPTSAANVRQALALLDLTVRPEPVEGPNANRTAETHTDNPLYRRTFVGREAELRQLQSAFDGAMSGQGALAMVVGEPGIGKTALVDQLATYVSLRGGRTLVGHCYEEGSLSLPYLAFVEAMRSYVLTREPDALKSDLGTGAADVARIVSDIRDRVNVELRSPGDPEDDRWRLFQSVTSFLRNASQVQPLLLVVEDLHWADRGTLDLLLHVARNLQGARLYVVGTYRDVEVDRAHPLSSTLAELSRATSFNRIRLRGLTIDEVQRMISNIRGQEVPWARAEMYYRQTEGNPLFIQELLRYLVEEGVVVREGGRYALADPNQPEAGVPEGLRDVIGKRLSRLSAECNRLLSVAAVIGRDFNLQTLHVVANASEEAVLSGLEEAIRVGVLEERSRLGAVSYRFAHAFFRQTLYEEMIAPRRLRLHQEIARALEAEYGARREDHAAELAEHFANSTDKADLTKAVQYGEKASQRAMSVFDYGEAVRLLERALAVQEVLDPDDNAKRCDLLLALGEALMPAGEPQRVCEELAEEAFSLAETLGDQRRASRACQVALDGIQRYGASIMWGAAVRRRWVERAGRNAAPGTADRVRADVAMAGVLMSQGRHAEAWAMRVPSLDAARELNDPELLFFTALSILGNPRPPRREALAFELANEFAQAPRDGVTGPTLGGVLFGAACAFLQHGERNHAEDLFRQLSELATRTQEAQLALRPFTSEAIIATLEGDLERAVRVSQQLVERADELGAPVAGRVNAIPANYALFCMGRGEEVLARRGAAIETAGVEPSAASESQTVWLLAQLGRLAEAGDVLGNLMRDRNINPENNQLSTANLLNLLQAAVLLRETEAAKVLARLLENVRSFSWSTRDTNVCPARLLGAAAALLGHPRHARDYYREAIEACAKLRFRPEIALTRLQLAELLLEESAKPNPLDLRTSPSQPDNDVGARSPRPRVVGDGAAEGEETSPLRGATLAAALRSEALEHLDFAISEFREMKMQPSLERALRHRGLLKA
ncbi:MAG TPA: protein kinase [Dehalococcoidia bacterium]|nr:protein kinase [Dehalococcoidia bacterium]